MPIQALIAGLGNPGKQYRDTRHNIGFRIVEAFAESFRGVWKTEARQESELATVSVEGISALLVKPQTFMNESGRAVGSLMRYYKIEPSRLLVVYDEIQLPPGQPKLSLRGSAGGHNGMISILAHCPGDIARLRVGIGYEKPDGMALADFVLTVMPAGDREIIRAMTPVYVQGIRLFLTLGGPQAMNYLNQTIAVHHGKSDEKLQSDLHPRHPGI